MTMSAALLLLLGTTTPAAPALAPSGQWLVEGQDNMCALSHTFGADGGEVTLALKPWPLGSMYDVLLFSRSSAADIRYGKAVIQVDDHTPSLASDSVEFGLRSGDRRLLSFKVDGAALDGLATAHSVTLTLDRRRIVLATTGTAKAVEVLATCQTLLRKQLGIQYDLAAGYQRSARPHGRESDWFTPDDYPPRALEGNNQGVSRLLLTIATDGRVARCVAFGSSGNAQMDRAACHAFEQRGRYLPALDAAGKPIEDYVQQSVRWVLG